MARQANRPIKTTATSLELLEGIKELDGATVGKLADHTGLARSTVHNHLQTLLDAEYVVKENNTYHVGLRLFHLGEYARTRKDEYRLAKEAVRELATRTQMEADFNIEEHGRLLNLFDTIGHTGDSGLEIGSYFYMHSTSAGKVILAEYPESRIDGIIETHGLPGLTENTITDRETLLSELETIRERGYAVNDEECFPGYRTISRAVHYPDGSVLGSIAVGGPTYLLGAEFDQSMHEALAETVRELEVDVETALFGR